MAHLTKPTKYNIEDSNIALLGSDLEKRVREHAGDVEGAWSAAGSAPGIQIWRIEKFEVKVWPKEKYGCFYDGDSYIVLHTYKKTPDSVSLSYHLHFWLGADTTQDEAGTAAYKTVELDDHLHGNAVQFREIQSFESQRFLSYFPRFLSLSGGVSTGFHHVESLPPPSTRKLYRINSSRTSHAGTKPSLLIREVPVEEQSLVEGDVYVLDMGTVVWQFNTQTSSGQERFKAADFVQSLDDSRQGKCQITVYDENGRGAGIFLAEFGEGVTLRKQNILAASPTNATSPILYKILDATGTVIFELVDQKTPTLALLSSQDAFLLDHSLDAVHPAVYVWLGTGASLGERRLASQYAQRYLYDKRISGRDPQARVGIPIVNMKEGDETDDFLQALGA